MNQESKHTLKLIIYPIITFILCILNAVYHEFTDWQIANLLYPNINLYDTNSYNDYSQLTLHSLYFSYKLLNKLAPLYFFIIFFGSGILTMYFFHLYFSKIKIPSWLKMMMIIIWIIKIPIPINLSALHATAAGLFVW